MATYISGMPWKPIRLNSRFTSRAVKPKPRSFYEVEVREAMLRCYHCGKKLKAGDMVMSHNRRTENSYYYPSCYRALWF